MANYTWKETSARRVHVGKKTKASSVWPYIQSVAIKRKHIQFEGNVCHWNMMSGRLDLNVNGVNGRNRLKLYAFHADKKAQTKYTDH